MKKKPKRKNPADLTTRNAKSYNRRLLALEAGMHKTICILAEHARRIDQLQCIFEKK